MERKKIVTLALTLLLALGAGGMGANLYAQDAGTVDMDREDTSPDWGLLGLLGLAGLLGLRRREPTHEVRTTAVPTR